MKYIIKCPDGRRYKVIEAISLRAACKEIINAQAFGAIGGISLYGPFDDAKVLANVIEINSDGTERQPYTATY